MQQQQQVITRTMIISRAPEPASIPINAPSSKAEERNMWMFVVLIDRPIK